MLQKSIKNQYETSRDDSAGRITEPIKRPTTEQLKNEDQEIKDQLVGVQVIL